MEINPEELQAMTDNLRFLNELRKEVRASIVDEQALTLENNDLSTLSLEFGESRDIDYKRLTHFSFILNGEKIVGSVNTPPTTTSMLGVFKALSGEITKLLLQRFMPDDNEAFENQGVG